MALLIILLIVFASIIFLLLHPIQITINSKQHIYKAEWRYLFLVRLMFKNEEPWMYLKVPFWKKEYNLLTISPSKTKKQPTTKKQKKKKPFNIRKKVKGLLKAIKIKQFYLNIDTDNYIWNAYLYPVFYFLGREKRQLHINYQGNVEILLIAQSRPIQIIYALLF